MPSIMFLLSTLATLGVMETDIVPLPSLLISGVMHTIVEYELSITSHLSFPIKTLFASKSLLNP